MKYKKKKEFVEKRVERKNWRRHGRDHIDSRPQKMFYDNRDTDKRLGGYKGQHQTQIYIYRDDISLGF